MASRSFSDLPPPSYEEAIAANILIGVNPPQPATDHAYVNVCDNRISGDVSNTESNTVSDTVSNTNDNQSVAESENEKPIIPVLTYIGCLLYIAVLVTATMAF
jgi:hypothetical protein